MSPLYALTLLCLVAQSSLMAMAAPVQVRGTLSLFPNLKLLSSDTSSSIAGSRVLSNAQTNTTATTTSSSASSTSTSTSFCSKWAAQCNTTCASIDSTATASSSCRISGQVMRRAQLGALSCKCGTQTITAKVLPQVYKPMSVAAASSSASAASTTSAIATTTVAATLPVVTRLAADAAMWHGHNFVPVSDAISDSIVASSSSTSPIIIGTWTPAGSSTTA